MPSHQQPDSSPASTPTAGSDEAQELASLKRSLAAANQKLSEQAGVKVKKPPTAVTMGRGIRRLVALFESVEDLIDESDRRFQAQVEDEGEAPVLSGNAEEQQTAAEEAAELKRSQDRSYESFKVLLNLVPRLKVMIADPECTTEMFGTFVSQLQKGANDARSDDVRRIKEDLALWLNESYKPPKFMDVKTRNDRGIQNDLTGSLLTSIEHDWTDEQVRADIRGGKIDVREDYFLRCLYPLGRGDPTDFEKGFLRSALLIKCYSAVFTSPSSSEAFEEEGEEGPARKAQKTGAEKKATKSTVASLLHMEGKVTPRSIAYVAVLLVFNLTDATHWAPAHNGFNFAGFYNFIVDFFEVTEGPLAQKQVAALLRWWNRQIFPHHVAAAAATHKSRKKLASQRALREAAEN